MQDFTVFRALGLSFKAWFRNFIPFTLLTALLYAPIVVYLVTFKADDSWSAMQTFNRAFMYPLYATIAVSALLPPLIVYKVVQDLNGQSVSFFTSLKFGLRGMIPAFILGGLELVLEQFGIIGVIVYMVLICMWFVAAPAAVAEKLANPFSALSRSMTLTQGRRWGIFGMLFLIGIVRYVVVRVLLETGSANFSFTAIALKLVIAVGIFYMFSGIVQAVSYVLLRQDKDGVSHDELAKVFE